MMLSNSYETLQCELLKRSLKLVFREWIGGNRRHSCSIKMKGFGENLSTLIWGSLCLQLGLVFVKIIIIIGRICLNSGLDFGVEKLIDMIRVVDGTLI